MARTKEKIETLKERFNKLWGATRFLNKNRRTRNKWVLQPFTHDPFVERMEQAGAKIQDRSLTRWKKAICGPQPHHLRALHKVLLDSYWVEPDTLTLLLETLDDPSFLEWDNLLDRCRPSVEICPNGTLDPATGFPKVVPVPRPSPVVQKVFRGRYGLVPGGSLRRGIMGFPIDKIGALVERRRLVDEIVMSKKHAGRTDQGRRELAELLFMCDEELLHRMKDQGGCKPWEAPGILENS